jgi:hypothetical protein
MSVGEIRICVYGYTCNFRMNGNLIEMNDTSYNICVHVYFL